MTLTLMNRCLRSGASIWLCTVILLCATAPHAAAQLRIVNYNIAQLRGNVSALENVLAALHADDKPGYAVPVSIFVFQEVRSSEINALQAAVNAAAPSGVTYTRATFTTSAFEDTSGGAQAMFYRSGFVTENAAFHQDLDTGAGRKTDRWQMRLTGYNSPLAWFYVYGSHLKADTGTANQNERLAGATTIRTNADGLGANQHIIYCGDFNFYNNGEPGYSHFVSSGNGQATDPLGTGPWNGSANPPNNANNIKHTQSPLSAGVNGLVGGGMNSRFDFQLSTAALHDGVGLSIIPGTYRSFGNDGAHYNLAIDSRNNFYYPGQLTRSNTLATNLRLASDHIPVVVDYQIPAMMSASMTNNYGRVIVGTPFSVSALISNTANVDFAIGADVLTFSASGTLGLSGTVPGSAEPLGPPFNASFPLNTSTAALRNGTVTISATSQGTQPTSIVLNTTGMVVRPANPSFLSNKTLTDLEVTQSYRANSGVQNLNFNIYNRGFDALQATLDIDEMTPVGAPFAYLGGATTGIGSTPATLNFTFDTTNATPGTYHAPIVIHASDEDIPGEDVVVMNLNLAITIESTASTCAADIAPSGGDGIVGVPDLLAVISAWGNCPPQPTTCPADIAPAGPPIGDGVVGVPDLLAVISNWGACPR